MSNGVLERLQAWVVAGRLRRLDVALVAQMQAWEPGAPDALWVAVAVLAHLEGRGHTCLPLTELDGDGVAAWCPMPDHLQAPPVPLLDAWPGDGRHWCTLFGGRSLVRWCVGAAVDWAPDSGQPLVLAGNPDKPVLYLRRHWVDEVFVAQALAQRAALQSPVDPQLARVWLDRLFPAEAGVVKPDWQKAACALAVRGGVTVLTGGPGTGKTYTAARLLALVFATHPDPTKLRVGLAAPTGKAAARLRSAIDQALQDLQTRVGPALDLVDLAQGMGPARTLHALLGARGDSRQFRHGAHNPLDLDVLVVDESSMVHLEMVAALLRALPAHTRLVLLGDKDQLASVEAGSVLGDLCGHAHQARYNAATHTYLLQTCGPGLPEPSGEPGGPLEQQTVMLRESRRFGTGIGRLAQAVNQGDRRLAAGLGLPDDGVVWWAPAPVHPEAVVALALHGRPSAPAGYAAYLELVRQPPHVAGLAPDDHAAWALAVLQAFDTFRILCAVHGGPWGDRAINAAVEAGLAQAGWLQPSPGWYTGRPVMVTRNEPSLGVSNGDVGVVLPGPSSGRLRFYSLDGDAVRSVPVGRLAHVETCFAMTVHKSQGSEFAHTVVVLPEPGTSVLSRELVYTAVTRARTHLSVVEPVPGLLAQASAQRHPRFSGLAAQLATAAPDLAWGER